MHRSPLYTNAFGNFSAGNRCGRTVIPPLGPILLDSPPLLKHGREDLQKLFNKQLNILIAVRDMPWSSEKLNSELYFWKHHIPPSGPLWPALLAKFATCDDHTYIRANPTCSPDFIPVGCFEIFSFKKQQTVKLTQPPHDLSNHFSKLNLVSSLGQLGK